MNPFQSHPNFYNQPIRLNKEEAEPLEVLQSFFQNCPLAEVRRILWQMVETSLVVPYSVFDEADHRQTLLWFGFTASWKRCWKQVGCSVKRSRLK